MKISENELIGAEVIEVGYIDNENEINYSIALKLKDGRIVTIGPTNWETLWICEGNQ